MVVGGNRGIERFGGVRLAMIGVESARSRRATGGSSEASAEPSLQNRTPQPRGPGCEGSTAALLLRCPVQPGTGTGTGWESLWLIEPVYSNQMHASPRTTHSPASPSAAPGPSLTCPLAERRCILPSASCTITVRCKLHQFHLTRLQSQVHRRIDRRPHLIPSNPIRCRVPLPVLPSDKRAGG